LHEEPVSKESGIVSDSDRIVYLSKGIITIKGKAKDIRYGVDSDKYDNNQRWSEQQNVEMALVPRLSVWASLFHHEIKKRGADS
jgi:hypothetical protein